MTRVSAAARARRTSSGGSPNHVRHARLSSAWMRTPIRNWISWGSGCARAMLCSAAPTAHRSNHTRVAKSGRCTAGSGGVGGGGGRKGLQIEAGSVGMDWFRPSSQGGATPPATPSDSDPSRSFQMLELRSSWRGPRSLWLSSAIRVVFLARRGHRPTGSRPKSSCARL